jgi:bacteriorhodopsin
MLFIIGIPILILLIGLTASTGSWLVAGLAFVVGAFLVIKAVVALAEVDSETH